MKQLAVVFISRDQQRSRKFLLMKKTFILFFFTILIFSGCSLVNGQLPTGENITSNNDQNEAYPIMPTPDMNSAYPINTPQIINNGYPAPDNSRKNGPKFEILKPVLNGSTIVSGNGPANVPIILIDVTEMGLLIDKTTIDQNGNFQFSLDEPLMSGHSIGLQIGDLANTDFNYNDFVFSSEYIDRPMIGIILAIAPVVDK